jgi:pimeloyl-ACP methyl ester carboxylesterase
MSAIFLDHEIVHYEVLGRGKPIIFLHGWVGSWRSWLPTMQVASAYYRTYAIDLWGFGDTSKQSLRYSLESQVELINSFLDQMGIAKFVLIGHGLGAVVALLYNQLNPGLVDRVMAVGYPLEENMVNARLGELSINDLVDWLLVRNMITEPVRVDAPRADARAVQTSLANMSTIGLKELWKQIKISCLLVHGQNDPAIEIPRTEQLSELPESVHSMVFEQSGHFPMLDETNKFNRLVNDFLALESGESPRRLQLKEEWKRRVR